MNGIHGQGIIQILTLMLICVMTLPGCSDNEKEEEIIPPEPDEETTIVSEHKAYVGHPFKAYLGKATNGYKVRNNYPERLKTTYMEIQDIGVVYIIPLCQGESAIHVWDKDNRLAEVIRVYATMWGSKQVEVENGEHPYVKPEVRVEAQDTQTKQDIEKELTQELKDRNGTLYTFDNQTRLFTMTFPDGRKGYEGTYECGADSLFMQTESVTKRYGHEVSPGNKFLIIREDRTEEFRQRYPNAGVTSVTTQETWRDYTISDIVPYP